MIYIVIVCIHFLFATVKYHKLTSNKTRSQNSTMSFMGIKSKCQHGCILPGGSQENLGASEGTCFLGLSSLLISLHSLYGGYLIISKPHHSIASVLTCHLPPHSPACIPFILTHDYMGPTCINLNNLPISRSSA